MANCASRAANTTSNAIGTSSSSSSSSGDDHVILWQQAMSPHGSERNDDITGARTGFYSGGGSWDGVESGDRRLSPVPVRGCGALHQKVFEV